MKKDYKNFDFKKEFALLSAINEILRLKAQNGILNITISEIRRGFLMILGILSIAFISIIYVLVRSFA